MDIRDRLGKVGAFANALADNILSAKFKLAIVEPLISDEITTLFRKTDGAHAHDALAVTLILDLVRDITAFSLDKDTRVASLANTWEMLRDKDLRSALREIAATPYRRGSFWGSSLSEEGKAQYLADVDREDIEQKGKAFDDALARAELGMDKILNSDLAKKFKIARNKVLAHYEMKASEKTYTLVDLHEADIKWGSPKEFLALVEPVIWDVVLVATWGSYDVDGFKEMHREYANDFWARIQGKGPAESAAS